MQHKSSLSIIQDILPSIEKKTVSTFHLILVQFDSQMYRLTSRNTRRILAQKVRIHNIGVRVRLYGGILAIYTFVGMAPSRKSSKCQSDFIEFKVNHVSSIKLPKDTFAWGLALNLQIKNITYRYCDQVYFAHILENGFWYMILPIQQSQLSHSNWSIEFKNGSDMDLS
ncbi:hypothetical protein SD51_00010 [Alicyclobacillus tengchongensis]|nr:hypothetical protein SD51_00010 [Alicyclobacillus tengchongensis]